MELTTLPLIAPRVTLGMLKQCEAAVRQRPFFLTPGGGLGMSGNDAVKHAFRYAPGVRLGMAGMLLTTEMGSLFFRGYGGRGQTVTLTSQA